MLCNSEVSRVEPSFSSLYQGSFFFQLILFVSYKYKTNIYNVFNCFVLKGFSLKQNRSLLPIWMTQL